MGEKTDSVDVAVSMDHLLIVVFEWASGNCLVCTCMHECVCVWGGGGGGYACVCV